MGKRFDFIKYDEEAMRKQAEFKLSFEVLDADIEKMLPAGRAKSLAITKLEEAYMWIGKGIRDEQIERNEKNNSYVKLQEERGDG